MQKVTERINAYRNRIARISFNNICAGVNPARPLNNIESICSISQAVVIVETATTPGSCIPCDANPLDLICRCKCARKIGICYHILLLTHIIMKDGPESERKSICNLKYMTSLIKGCTKKGKGKGRPKQLKKALEREDVEEDDDNAPRLLKW